MVVFKAVETYIRIKAKIGWSLRQSMGEILGVGNL